MGEVAKAGNAQADDLRSRKTKLKDLRQMAMELSYRHSNFKQKKIGADLWRRLQHRQPEPIPTENETKIES
jgi:UDP-N-acetylenolpyruvoylglucosamine reductase